MSASDSPDHIDDARPVVWRHVAWFVICLVVALGPGVAAILTPFELWPWTSAPMFAYSPVDNARHVVDFTVVTTDGTRRPFNAAVAGYSSWNLPRSFLNTGWGADIAGSPWRHVDIDTPELRRARVTRWFEAIVEFNRRKKNKKNDFLNVAFIEVGLTPHNGTGTRRLIGRHDLVQQRFYFGDEVAP